MIIAVANNKGGVGKTTTTVNLSEALAKKGKRILVVDVDGQASASMALGLGRSDLQPSLSDVVFPADEPQKQLYIKDIIRKDVIKGVDLIPADTDLYNFDVNYSEVRALTGFSQDIHNVLQERIAPLKKYYDYIFIDCPPAFSLITINALYASEACIIPITPNYLSAEGFQNLLQMVDQIEAGLEKKTKILGIVVNMVDSRTVFHREMIDLLEINFPKEVFKSNINQSIRFQEAPSHNKTLMQYDPNSKAVTAYMDLATEFIERTEKEYKSRVIPLPNKTLREASA